MGAAPGGGPDGPLGPMGIRKLLPPGGPDDGGGPPGPLGQLEDTGILGPLEEVVAVVLPVKQVSQTHLARTS